MKKLSPSGGGGSYLVVHCGAAGHNIRSKPGIKGTPVGRLTKGNRVEASEEVCNRKLLSFDVMYVVVVVIFFFFGWGERCEGW